MESLPQPPSSSSARNIPGPDEEHRHATYTERVKDKRGAKLAWAVPAVQRDVVAKFFARSTSVASLGARGSPSATRRI